VKILSHHQPVSAPHFEVHLLRYIPLGKENVERELTNEKLIDNLIDVIQ